MKRNEEWSMAFDPEGKTLSPDPNEGMVKQYAKAYRRFDKNAKKKVEEPLVMGFDQRDAVIEEPRKSKKMVKRWADLNDACDKAKVPKKQHFKQYKPSDK